MNQLWEMPLKIAKGAGEMPDGMTGAIAIVFAGAKDYEEALWKGVTAVREMNYVFEDVTGGRLLQIAVEDWDEYASNKWPEFAANLPIGSEMPAIVNSGQVFFGPFLGYQDAKD